MNSDAILSLPGSIGLSYMGLSPSLLYATVTNVTVFLFACFGFLRH